jgi:SAM-dependent methyltransferase
MGKQSRRKRERSPGEAKALRYLARLGLPDHPDPGPYQRLAAADPDWFGQLGAADDAALALAARPDATREEIGAAVRDRYRLLYRDLDTALAEYAWRPVMIAGAWLRWWFEHHPPATRLLDAGCGPGVLTCAYGLALPGAEVVGVDAVPEAVACAEELAGRLGVRNVTFVVADYLDPAAGGGEFDQLVAVAALADAGLYPQNPADAGDALSSVADVDGPGREFRSGGVDQLVGRLAPGGWLLAFERTADVAQAVRLGAALVHGGVDLDLDRAGAEVFVEHGEPTTFTRFAGVRAAAPATSSADVAAWLKRAKPPAYGPAWHDELRFEALKASGARLVWRCEIDYRPQADARERREVWEDDGRAYGWISATPQSRQLVSGRRADELKAEYSAFAGRLAAAGFNVRLYPN